MQQQIETANQSTCQQQAEHPDECVLLSSRKSGWDRILLEHLQFPPLDISNVRAMSHYLTLQLGAPKTMEFKVNGKFRRKLDGAGKRLYYTRTAASFRSLAVQHRSSEHDTRAKLYRASLS
ncbi:MAG: hypothetical protein PUP92_24855 [Rhizonema sp. PD38]|nr:hypothetical protein [Rhizonema sp. PD38]